MLSSVTYEEPEILPARPPGTPLEIPGAGRLPEGQAVKILYEDAHGRGTQELVLCRVEGELRAMDSLCPHEGGRLASGPLMDGCYAICPLHLYKFDPKTGAAVDVECDPVPVYPVEEVDGVARVDLLDGNPPAGGGA